MNTEERLTAAADPGVVALVLAQDFVRDEYLRSHQDVRLFVAVAGRNDITANMGQARALLDAVRAWDIGNDRLVDPVLARRRLDIALTAIVGAS